MRDSSSEKGRPLGTWETELLNRSWLTYVIGLLSAHARLFRGALDRGGCKPLESIADCGVSRLARLRFGSGESC